MGKSPDRRRSSRGGPADIEVELEGSGRVVIVAEKDTALRRKLRDALERRGYTVFEAEDGAQALQLGKHFDSPADLLLADAKLPKLSGRDLVGELASAGKLPKVLYVADSKEQSARRRSTDHPVIEAPFDADQLARRVGEVLGLEMWT